MEINHGDDETSANTQLTSATVGTQGGGSSSPKLPSTITSSSLGRIPEDAQLTCQINTTIPPPAPLPMLMTSFEAKGSFATRVTSIDEKLAALEMEEEATKNVTSEENEEESVTFLVDKVSGVKVSISKSRTGSTYSESEI